MVKLYECLFCGTMAPRKQVGSWFKVYTPAVNWLVFTHGLGNAIGAIFLRVVVSPYE
jgi:hypothetical protein